MDEFDKNFIKNMSPLLITAVVMFFLMVAYETKAEKSEVLYSTTGEAIGIVGYSEEQDSIVGYTHDGIAVYQSEVDEAEALAEAEVNWIRVRHIKGSKYLRKENILQLTMKDKKVINVHFYGRCMGMESMTNLGFEAFGSYGTSTQTITLTKGDSFIPINFSNAGAPCMIKKMLLVADVG